MGFRTAARNFCVRVRNGFPIAILVALPLAACANNPLVNPIDYFNPNFKDPRICMDGNGQMTFKVPEQGVFLQGQASGALWAASNGGDVPVDLYGSIRGADVHVFASGGDYSQPQVVFMNTHGQPVTLRQIMLVATDAQIAAQREAYQAAFAANGACSPSRPKNGTGGSGRNPAINGVHIAN